MKNILLNEVIKKSTGDNQAANAMAHAVLGAVTAHASGNGALAGAAGAATAELMAPAIIASMGWDKNNLTEEQKQTVAALSTLAAGLTGGLAGDSTGDALAGAQTGKNAVENNSLLNKDCKNPMTCLNKPDFDGGGSGRGGAYAPMGSKQNQMNQPKNPAYQPVRNEAANVNGREYSGHALDRMQDRGITPSVIENTIKNGSSIPSRGGTTSHYDSSNNISVITNESGRVVTIKYGK